MNAEELAQRMVNMSKGTGGVVAISLDDWSAIRHAYGDTPLLRGISERGLSVLPVAAVDTNEVDFRIGLVPPGPLMPVGGKIMELI